MKIRHDMSKTIASLIVTGMLGCILGLLSTGLPETVSDAASWAGPAAVLSPTPPVPKVWFPSIFRNRLACSDPYEPNNSSSTAPLIGAGGAISVTLSANFCAGDPDDIYRIDAQVATSSTLVVALGNAPADTDLDLYLYDGQLSLVAWSNAGGNGEDERIEYGQMRTGPYFIRVYPFATPPNGDTRWYRLQVRLGAQ